MKKFLFLPLAAMALSACSLNRTAARVTSGVIDKGLPAVFSQDDPEYVREALPANLQLMEILLKSDPDNRKMLVNAAQGFCGYAFMFLEDTEPARASAFYLKGEAYAGRALRGATAETARRQDVPALFWRTFCRASHININRDDPEAIAELPALEPAAEAVLKLDPSYYYNGAHTILGAYYSIRPKMLGGDPEKAREHFEQALKGGGGDFQLNRYMYARMAAVALQDQELFEKLLNSVIEAGPRAGDTRLPDEVARTKAKKLLEKKDELF
ncbi:MAG: TRAP transporter TatT component family protein [Elusimicrobia bacterium]|nr:TRAP transporter TatT component family protein [Elusimicrobiota bacterium]